MDYFQPGTISPKYTNFNILETVYKTVNNQDINAYIVIPKNAKPGKHPIIVKWHGGGFATGAALYPDWFPDWLISYIETHSAILIAPNYRLIPESRGPDILSDVSSFWTWLTTSLPSLLSTTEATTNLFGPGITANLNQILVTGESAGGTLSVISALSFSRLGEGKGRIRACIATYPGWLAFDEEWYKEKVASKNIRAFGRPDVSMEVWEEHMAAIVPGQIVTSCDPPGRVPLVLLNLQRGVLYPYLRGDDNLYPFKVLEKVEKGVPPYILIIHGKQDTAVDIENSKVFVERAKRRLGEGRVELVARDGEHGFDVGVGLEEAWLVEALRRPTEEWLGEGK